MNISLKITLLFIWGAAMTEGRPESLQGLDTEIKGRNSDNDASRLPAEPKRKRTTGSIYTNSGEIPVPLVYDTGDQPITKELKKNTRRDKKPTKIKFSRQLRGLGTPLMPHPLVGFVVPSYVMLLPNHMSDQQEVRSPRLRKKRSAASPNERARRTKRESEYEYVTFYMPQTETSSRQGRAADPDNSGPQIMKLKVRRGGVAIAGPGGIATAGAGGTAIVGPGGTAYASASGTAIVGPGGKVVQIPSKFEPTQVVKARRDSNDFKVVATGPVVYTPVERNDILRDFTPPARLPQLALYLVPPPGITYMESFNMSDIKSMIDFHRPSSSKKSSQISRSASVETEEEQPYGLSFLQNLGLPFLPFLARLHNPQYSTDKPERALEEADKAIERVEKMVESKIALEGNLPAQNDVHIHEKDWFDGLMKTAEEGSQEIPSVTPDENKPTSLVLKPVAKAVAGPKGVAIASPVARAVLRQGQPVNIEFDPDTVAIAGPGGTAHSHPKLIISYDNDTVV